jgi:DNA-binding IclR family transcriptional regulator
MMMSPRMRVLRPRRHDRKETSLSGKSSKLPGTPVKPVINAIRILRYISSNRAAARASQIAQDLSLNPSTCFNILRTLVGEDILSFDALSKTYGLSKRLLGQDTVETLQLSLSKPILSGLAQTYNVAVTIWRRISHDRLIMVAIEHGPAKMRVDIPLGMRLPTLIGATGRLIAARSEMERAELEQAFHTLRWAVPITFDMFWAQANLAGTRGWAVDDGHSWHGVTSVAAPILNLCGSFSLSLTAIAFAGQYRGQAIEQLGEAIRIAAGQISDILYHRVETPPQS